MTFLRDSIGLSVWKINLRIVFFVFRYSSVRICCAHFHWIVSYILLVRFGGHGPHSLVALLRFCLQSSEIGRQSCRELLAGKFTLYFQFFESSNVATGPCIEGNGVHSLYTPEWRQLDRYVWTMVRKGSPCTGMESWTCPVTLWVCREVLWAILRDPGDSKDFHDRCYSLVNLLNSRAPSKRTVILFHMHVTYPQRICDGNVQIHRVTETYKLRFVTWTTAVCVEVQQNIYF
jgi:hypothetical protein